MAQSKLVVLPGRDQHRTTSDVGGQRIRHTLRGSKNSSLFRHILGSVQSIPAYPAASEGQGKRPDQSSPDLNAARTKPPAFCDHKRVSGMHARLRDDDRLRWQRDRVANLLSPNEIGLRQRRPRRQEWQRRLRSAACRLGDPHVASCGGIKIQLETCILMTRVSLSSTYVRTCW